MRAIFKSKWTVVVVVVIAALCIAAAGVFLFPSEAIRKMQVKKVVRVSPAASSVTYAKGKSVKFKAACQPSSAKAKYKKLTYKSSNSKVISVTKSGSAKAKKNGTAVVTAKNTYSGR